MQKIRIAILDDHQIVIDGLKLLLTGQLNIEIVAENTNGWKLAEVLPNIEVDILLTDLMMPNIDGFEMALLMKQQFPTIKVIALSMNGEGRLIDKLVTEAGVAGYLLKTVDKQELLTAIEIVANGDTYFSEDILAEMEAYAVVKKEREAMNLTTREIEIIKKITTGITNKQIAEMLFISERTVETHRKNIFRKANVHSVASLIEFAQKQGIV